ncbi:MAG: hypothetical protein NC833_04105 [Candidatus Omnitrophica bacterium]|nr:hypothetical protein [Candidatus Omnitrophota bacterium]
MLVVFKSTIIDILKSKKFLYIFILGVIILAMTPGKGLIIKIESGNYSRDLSDYVRLFLQHFFIYIFLLTVSIHIAEEIEEEKREKFHEISLIYISRTKFFTSKLVAYVFGFSILLLFIGFISLAFSQLIFGLIQWSFFCGVSMISYNILFISVLSSVFALSKTSRGGGLLSFMLYVVFSLLNSKTLINWIVGSEKISTIISYVSPSVFLLQNEFLKVGMRWGFSNRFSQYFLNFTIYLILSLFIFTLRVRKYECKV